MSGMSNSQLEEEQPGESREDVRKYMQEVEDLLEAIDEEQSRCEGVKAEIDECKGRYFGYRDSLLEYIEREERLLMQKQMHKKGNPRMGEL